MDALIPVDSRVGLVFVIETINKPWNPDDASLPTRTILVLHGRGLGNAQECGTFAMAISNLTSILPVCREKGNNDGCENPFRDSAFRKESF
jgi:hypothetical protein